jgi:NAD(P)-dependent dehydrogenase (short-subunit alcohol dehydrogenase family)
VEELTEQQLRDQLETNLFGAMWVTQAALPYRREQGSGHIVQISSTGGVAAWPLLGGYHASKWASGGPDRVAGPGSLRSRRQGDAGRAWRLRHRLGGTSAVHAESNPAYDGVREQLDAFVRNLDSDHPPLRVFFGTQRNQMLSQAYTDRLKTWADSADLAVRAHG